MVLGRLNICLVKQTRPCRIVTFCRLLVVVHLKLIQGLEPQNAETVDWHEKTLAYFVKETPQT